MKIKYSTQNSRVNCVGSSTTRCDGCISAHAGAAKKQAPKEEVAAALGTAIALNAGAAYVYSARTLDAYDEM